MKKFENEKRANGAYWRRGAAFPVRRSQKEFQHTRRWRRREATTPHTYTPCGANSTTSRTFISHTRRSRSKQLHHRQRAARTYRAAAAAKSAVAAKSAETKLREFLLASTVSQLVSADRQELLAKISVNLHKQLQCSL